MGRKDVGRPAVEKRASQDERDHTECESGEPLCRSLEISVPSRLRLPDATLREGEGAHMMQIDAPRGVDFSRACESGLIFPDEDGGAMEIDQGSMPGGAHCDAGLIRVPVRFRAGRVRPVRIIVPGMSLPGSTRVEGISWVTPPEPEWTITTILR